MSSVQIQPTENRIPLGAEVREGKFCENCGRNFYRCLDSKQNRCCTCQAMIVCLDNQLWGCTECGMLRAWGTGRPYETTAKLLKCDHCGEVTEHEYWNRRLSS